MSIDITGPFWSFKTCLGAHDAVHTPCQLDYPPFYKITEEFDGTK